MFGISNNIWIKLIEINLIMIITQNIIWIIKLSHKFKKNDSPNDFTSVVPLGGTLKNDDFQMLL